MTLADHRRALAVLTQAWRDAQDPAARLRLFQAWRPHTNALRSAGWL